jgi:predicted transcriptional regulator
MREKKKRSRMEIIIDILTVFLDETKTKRTRITERAHLNWNNFQKYSDFLLEEGLIAKCNIPEVEVYELTKKGRDLLKRLKGVEELLQ